MTVIAVTESQKKIVLSILTKYFPSDEWFVFGSRATSKGLKPFSDLDIAVQGSGALDAQLILQALEEFSSSDWPFKVDLVDLRTISDEFLNKISPDLRPLS